MEMVVVRVVVAKGHGGERKKEEKVVQKKKMGEKMVFCRLGPNLLSSSAIKIKFIYKGSKRDTLSLVVPNLGPWFDQKTSQPLVQNSNDELSVLCRKMVGQVGHFRVVSPPLKPRSARTIHTDM